MPMTFIRDRRGSAAVEFAFIAPIMLLMYFGLAEMTQAMMAGNRAQHVASTVGDLVSQTPAIDQQSLDDVWLVADAIMKPFPTGSLSMRITSVKADAAGTASLGSLHKAKGSALPELTAVPTLPAGLLTANESILVAESSYTYTSPIQQTLPHPVTFKAIYYLKPRKSTEVLWIN